MLNINPRSLYNKKEEFITLVDEEEIDVGCISETWERKKLPLDKLIKIDGYEIYQMFLKGKKKVDDLQSLSILANIMFRTSLKVRSQSLGE